jgi:hypothetical protein
MSPCRTEASLLSSNFVEDFEILIFVRFLIHTHIVLPLGYIISCTVDIYVNCIMVVLLTVSVLEELVLSSSLSTCRVSAIGGIVLSSSISILSSSLLICCSSSDS